MRPNYDDLNEMFWNPSCLAYTYHCLDPDRGLQNIAYVAATRYHGYGLLDGCGCICRPLTKTFRERSSYLAILVNFFPW